MASHSKSASNGGANGHGDVEAAGYNSEHQPATLTWKDICVTSKGKEAKPILRGITGYVLPKQMLAIMGPSGSGKTTLLDTLAGRQAANVSVDGQVLINGRQSNLSYGRSSYVTQDEEFVGVLTVRETITFAAQLRLSSAMSWADKEARVDSVLQELGLVDAQHVKIGNWYLKGISGGQRRRVAIGCELVTHPTLLFLDEPTSGLDAASAYFVMSTIRTLAAHNRTILTVIHQPSSEVFELFDQLALLSSGSSIFFGPASQALAMFEQAGLPCPLGRSATDHFLHVINQEFKDATGQQHAVQENVDALVQVFKKQLLPAVLSTVEEHSVVRGEPYLGQENKANPVFQVLVLTHRNLINNWRNIGLFWLRLGMYLMLCICIGTIFLKLGYSWQDTYSRASLLFFVVAFLTFMSISGFPAFVENMLIFIRERLNGYYPVGTFVIADTLASVPFIFGIALSCSCVVYWLVGLDDQGDRFPFFFMCLFASLLTVESLMMAIAAIVPHYLMGIAAGAGMMGMFMLVCGFFQPVPSIPKPVWVYPMHYISYHSYAFAGFMRNEFIDTNGWGCPCYQQSAGCGPQYNATNPCTVSGQDVLDFYITGNISTMQKWLDFVVLIGMSIGYRCMFWGMLVLKEWLATSM